MKQALIIYESGYGNTRQVAERIAEGLRENQKVTVNLAEVKAADIGAIGEADIVLLGSPNHMGKPTGSITKFIDKIDKNMIGGKTIAVFDTYMFNDYEKAAKRIEQQIKQKAPGLKMAGRLSIRVKGMKGPIAEGEIEKASEFGITIAASLSG